MNTKLASVSRLLIQADHFCGSIPFIFLSSPCHCTVTRIPSESALHVPYDVAHAQKDYETIVLTLTHIQKTLDDADMLNVSPADNTSREESPVSFPDVLARASKEKSLIDTEFEKIVAAADAAKTRIHL